MNANTESIKYLIDAEDRASAKIRKSKDEVKKMVTEVKNLGGRSKASAELVGTLANQIGSTGTGAAAGEIAQLIERVSAFSEVAKAGGKGAFALRAGIVAATAVIAGKLGAAIGNVIFQTEKWKRVQKEALDELRINAGRAAQALGKAQDRGIAMAETLNEIGRQDELERLFKKAGQEADGAASNVQKIKKQLDELRGSESDLGLNELVNAAFIENAEADLEIAKQALEAARGRKEQLQDMISPAAKALEIAKERFEAESRSAEKLEELKNQLDVARATGDARLRIELSIAGVMDREIESALAMRKEIDAIAEAEKKREEAKREADRKEKKRISEKKAARKKAAAERAREEKKVADFQKKTLDAIKQQLIEQTKGKAAAEAARLAQGGFDEQEARSIARFKDRIDKLIEAKKQTTITDQPNTAKDERLVSGRAAASFRKTAAVIEAERQTKIQTELRDAMKSLLEFERSRPQLEINVHGN